jgi:hypothetical protein
VNRAGRLGEQPAEPGPADLRERLAAHQLGVVLGKVRLVDDPGEQDLVGAAEEHGRGSRDQRDRDELGYGDDDGD